MTRLRNRRRERFAIEIASMTPLGRAYEQAGFKGGPWARPNATKLCRVPEVARRIAELQEEFRERAGIHAEYLQQLLLPVAEANIADFYERGPDGKPRWRAVADLPRDLASAIASVEHDDAGAVRAITFHNKISAATTLLRSVGGLVDRNEISGRDGSPLFERMPDTELNAKIMKESIEIFASAGISAQLVSELRAEVEEICADDHGDGGQA